MEQRPLGTTGLQVSALGYGSGAIGGLFTKGDPDEQRRAIARALDAGITYYDTASSYGDGRSEENLGRVLRELNAWDRAIVGTKVRLSVDDLQDPVAAIERSAEASLRRLAHDSVDLLQLHNPIVPRGAGARLRASGGSIIRRARTASTATGPRSTGSIRKPCGARSPRDCGASRNAASPGISDSRDWAIHTPSTAP